MLLLQLLAAMTISEIQMIASVFARRFVVRQSVVSLLEHDNDAQRPYLGIPLAG
jgi:hypothetical protein